MPSLPSALGEKLRHGGLLVLGVFVGAAGASIHGLRLTLGFQVRVMWAVLRSPSSYAFLWVGFSEEEPISNALIISALSRRSLKFGVSVAVARCALHNLVVEF